MRQSHCEFCIGQGLTHSIFLWFGCGYSIQDKRPVPGKTHLMIGMSADKTVPILTGRRSFPWPHCPSSSPFWTYFVERLFPTAFFDTEHFNIASPDPSGRLARFRPGVGRKLYPAFHPPDGSWRGHWWHSWWFHHCTGQAQARDKVYSQTGKTRSHRLPISDSAFPHGNLVPAGLAQPCRLLHGKNDTFSFAPYISNLIPSSAFAPSCGSDKSPCCVILCQSADTRTCLDSPDKLLWFLPFLLRIYPQHWLFGNDNSMYFGECRPL